MEFAQYTPEEFERRYTAWRDGRMMIQEAFAELSGNGREFIKSGITHDEWEKESGGSEVIGDSGRTLG